ncbi:DJ-1/PfpI family protein [Paraburkholderia sp. CNPSo 3274]|uniref:DJ-1/PfpI family protein n=1 Tax=Paraburkholderia sp. CNPSo 3274 TaxID=2940932 RepID=UPI0020B769B5|nr:DJ-1/PfpI family protein [Paraburkholderia sp. CNPSo 3274]MCP3709307.1 DJ-1/PfpI family protein [Paraburkholderia sp. CNPSo 3274]
MGIWRAVLQDISPETINQSRRRPNMRRILMIVSSARELPLEGGDSLLTGYWADEVYTPLRRFRAAGVDVRIHTVDGRPGIADPFSLEPRFHYPDTDRDFLAAIVRSFADDPEGIRFTLHHFTELDLIASRRVYEALTFANVEHGLARANVEAAAKESWKHDIGFLEALAARPKISAIVPPARAQVLADSVKHDSERLAQTCAHSLENDRALNAPYDLRSLSDEEIHSFDAVFIPGGHGAIVDLPDNRDVERVLRLAHSRRRLIALLCHGPAALLSVGNGPDGGWLFDGYRVAAFSNEEEDQAIVGLQRHPWFLESELKNRGVVYDEAPPWVSHVVVDRHLLTAQNQMSDEACAEAVLRKLGALQGSAA